MGRISIDDTLLYTKDLTVLYVEDDLDLQAHTKEFFEVLFHSVKVANNGQEALNMYKKEHFDIVVSDIKMPLMDGVELTTNIKEMNPHQSIIITSAYNDAEYLLTFINLNIRQFLQKPIQIDNMIETLYYASKHIVNEKMIEEYRQELEETNKELNSKNNELQSLVRILDAKLVQIAKGTQPVSHEDTTMTEEHLDELQEIETDISGAAVLISLSKNLSAQNIKVLGDMFLNYASIVQQTKAFDSLSKSIKELGETLTSAPENFIKRVQDISILLESFIYVLRMWRQNIINSEVQKAFELHTSMMNDIETIIAIINNKEDQIQSEMEFFND